MRQLSEFSRNEDVGEKKNMYGIACWCGLIVQIISNTISILVYTNFMYGNENRIKTFIKDSTHENYKGNIAISAVMLPHKHPASWPFFIQQ